MMTIYIISGVSKGLGYALAENLLKSEDENTKIMGLSRNMPDFVIRFPKYFDWVKTDFKNPEEISINLEFALKKYSPTKMIYISNAGDINPINKIGEIASQEMIDSLSVNILSPANCINYLINNYSNIKQLLIINISSGAANKAIKGWSLYSSAKAYMKTYFDVLVAEMKDKTYGRIIVKQIDPGAMDTDMQEDIRNANVSSEQLDKLKNLYENNNLKQPKDVAEMIIQSIREIL
jgi:benzil reductase ((S)-benzoin forming)